MTLWIIYNTKRWAEWTEAGSGMQWSESEGRECRFDEHPSVDALTAYHRLTISWSNNSNKRTHGCEGKVDTKMQLEKN